MRILVFFDLPVQKSAERKLATQFRKFLIDDGYYMLQYSVYSRICNSVENAESHFKRLSIAAPKVGSVRCMIVTEKQYNTMRIICGTKSVQERPAEFIQISFL